MNKAVLMCFSPRECEKIASKIISKIQKNGKPIISTPFKVYIYCSEQGLHIFGNEKTHTTDALERIKTDMIEDFEKTTGLGLWNGKVIGEFLCNSVDNGLSLNWNVKIYDWSISDVKFYDKPKSIESFYNFCDNNCEGCDYLDVQEIGAYENTKEIRNCLNFLKKAPTNWCYIKTLEGNK